MEKENIQNQSFWKNHLDRSYDNSKIKKRRFKMLFKFFKENYNVELFDDSNVLDVGCNTGLGISIAYKIFNCNVFGVDINEDAIKKAAIKLNPSNFTCSDIRTLEYFKSYPDNFFDLTYTCGVLMHITHGGKKDCKEFRIKKDLINEIIRVSKNVLLYESYHDTEPLSYVQTHRQKLGINHHTWEDYRLYNDSIELLINHVDLCSFKMLKDSDDDPRYGPFYGVRRINRKKNNCSSDYSSKFCIFGVRRNK